MVKKVGPMSNKVHLQKQPSTGYEGIESTVEVEVGVSETEYGLKYAYRYKRMWRDEGAPS